MRSQYAAFVHFLKQRWEASEVCRSPSEGCSEAEIEQIKKRQRVNHLPQMYVEFMSKMGRNMGGLDWHIGVDLRYPFVLRCKDETFAILDKPDILVLTHDADADCALFIHTDEEDPVVHHIGYRESNPNDELVDRAYGSFSSWLVDIIEGLIEEYEIMKQRNMDKGEQRE